MRISRRRARPETALRQSPPATNSISRQRVGSRLSLGRALSSSLRGTETPPEQSCRRYSLPLRIDPGRRGATRVIEHGRQRSTLTRVDCRARGNVT